MAKKWQTNIFPGEYYDGTNGQAIVDDPEFLGLLEYTNGKLISKAHGESVPILVGSFVGIHTDKLYVYHAEQAQAFFQEVI